MIGGVLAAAWPKVTLWTLALIVGLSLIVHGIVRIAIATTARDEIPGWGWLAFAGVVNVLLGVLAIAWPQATVLVLSLILGTQIALFGLLLLVAAFLRPRPCSHWELIDMPGLLRGVARTAVVAGTATAVSNRVSRRQANRWANQEAPQERPQEADYDQPAAGRRPAPTTRPSSRSSSSSASSATPAC